MKFLCFVGALLVGLALTPESAYAQYGGYAPVYGSYCPPQQAYCPAPAPIVHCTTSYVPHTTTRCHWDYVGNNCWGPVYEQHCYRSTHYHPVTECHTHPGYITASAPMYSPAPSYPISYAGSYVGY